MILISLVKYCVKVKHYVNEVRYYVRSKVELPKRTR